MATVSADVESHNIIWEINLYVRHRIPRISLFLPKIVSANNLAVKGKTAKTTTF